MTIKTVTSGKDGKLSYEVANVAKESSCSICISLDENLYTFIILSVRSDITGINVAMLTSAIQGHA